MPYAPTQAPDDVARHIESVTVWGTDQHGNTVSTVVTGDALAALGARLLLDAAQRAMDDASTRATAALAALCDPDSDDTHQRNLSADAEDAWGDAVVGAHMATKVAQQVGVGDTHTPEHQYTEIVQRNPTAHEALRRFLWPHKVV